MSYYYKYQFISPEPIYATVKEELKSYFDTGAVDDLLFPTYLDKALQKLGRTSYVISEEFLFIDDFQARLPDNFYAAREAWMCAEITGNPYQAPNSFYSQAADSTTIQIAPLTIEGTPCNSPTCRNPHCEGTCMPELVQAVYKTNTGVERRFTQEYLLRPGNISARQNCGVDYAGNLQFTPGSSSDASFDIRDNKFITSFRNGVVRLMFYATEYDHIGNQLVPDNFRIREYVEAFLKFKIFEMLTNQTNDETFNQLQQKMMYHKQAYEEAYIMANIEIKKQTPWEKQRRIKNDLNRNNMYKLSDRTNVYGRRRNN